MPRLIQSYADCRASSDPAARAVVLGQEELTYGALSRWSNSLARALQFHGCRRGDRVALVMSKTPLAIASVLGILKADCTYVPLDVDGPTPRAMHILRNADPRLLLVDASGAKTLQLLRGFRAASIETATAVSDAGNYAFAAEDIVRFSPEPIHYLNTPDDIAYILYTSGSTGIPKGVPITHSSVSCFIDWAVSYFNITSHDRISGHPPLYFDLSVFDIFGTFAAGAELHLVPTSHNLSAAAMTEFIRRSELTQWFSVPSMLNYLAKFDVVRRECFSKLKRVLWCGEVLPVTTLRYWMQRLPGVQFTNLYGPTETTIASSYHTVTSMPDPNQCIPIGRACKGESLLVLDDARHPVPEGVLGELYVAGAGLSPGYWRDEVKTREVFFESPYGRIYKTGDLAKIGRDGLIYFVGRTDNQIKSRGYRIDLGEIEAALNCIDDLKESAVVTIPATDFEGSLICCAFAPISSSRLTSIRLREKLGSSLPQYMLPRRWLSMNQLPKNTNGKIDRPLLKKLFEGDEV